jgi:hypothetical protein
MPDRTAEVVQFIRESYPTFEFVHIHLSNAFDKRWWKTIRGGPLTKSDLVAQLDSGAVGTYHYRSGSNGLQRRSRIQTLR